MELWVVKSYFTLEDEPLLVVEGLVGGFRGTMVSGKLPKVKEKPAAASIWMATLAERKTPLLNAIKLAARTPENPLPGAPTVGLRFRQVHQGYAWR